MVDIARGEPPQGVDRFDRDRCRGVPAPSVGFGLPNQPGSAELRDGAVEVRFAHVSGVEELDDRQRPLVDDHREQPERPVVVNRPEQPPDRCRDAGRGGCERRLASTTGADVRYRADGTVDYLAERGDDCGETLSAQSGALIGDPRIRESGRASPTAVRVVSDSDAQTFADSDVTTGEREVVLVDELDSTSESRLQTRADSLADEIAGGDRYLEIDVGVDPEAVTETPSVGDRCPVRLPAAGIDTTLRVIERDRVIDGDGDRLDRVLFANRLETLQGR